jgi:hypothetical protein
MPKCSKCKIRKEHLEALAKNDFYVAPRAECKRLEIDRENCDDFTPIPKLRIVEGVEGIWHYHLSETGLNSHPALCGKANVMQTEIPLSAWGKRSHLSETYCKECEKIWKEKFNGHK